MTVRRRLIRVPASSANLGPGFDVLAAALSLELELEVVETGEFSVDAGEGLPADRSNLCVRAFERLHAAEGLRFQVRSSIPVGRGLGSSAAAIVAGLVAADHMFELGLDAEQIYAHAAELEGHPDNVAAALYGGFVLCPRPAGEGQAPPTPVRLDPPQGVEAVLVIPHETVPTDEARAAMPATVELSAAIANVAAASQLVLGIERSDLGLIARGLEDRLHQPARTPLYRRSIELIARAPELGAIGATISGAGPAVMLWCYWQDTGKVVEAATGAAAGWADIRRVPFTPLGADVAEL